MVFPEPHNILQHEIIGLEAEVLIDSNPCNNKIKGIITDETMNTLVIKTPEIKKIAKKNAVFIFNLNGKAVKVEGQALCKRPEDRVKNKMRKW